MIENQNEDHQRKNRNVLVLNKYWQAVRIVSLKRAVSLLFKTYHDGHPKASIIDFVNGAWVQYDWESWEKIYPNEDEEFIVTPKRLYKFPSIILLGRYEGQPRERKRFTRREIYKRDKYHCQYCGDKLILEEFTIDHIIPRSKGGATSWENCVLSCSQCNWQKGDRTPEEAYKNGEANWKGASPMRLLKPPIKPKNLFNGLTSNIPETWKSFLEHIN